MGMLPAAANGDASKRTASDNQTVRNVFVVGPDKKIKLILVYPMTTGRNFDEVLRVVDALQLTAKFKVATPVNWQQGEDVIIAGSVTTKRPARCTRKAGRQHGLTFALCRNRSAKPHSAGYPAWETRPRASAALSFRRSVRAFAWRLKNE